MVINMVRTNKKNEVWTAVLDKFASRTDLSSDLIIIHSDQVNAISKQMGGPDFRNLSKFDKREDRPSVFRDNNLNIMPISRSEYVVGPMEEYHPLVLTNKAEDVSYERFKIPNLLTLQGETTSWISAGLAVHALDKAFDDSDLIRTITGRMGGGSWSFRINHIDNADRRFELQLKNPQIEIDTVLETPKAIYILEAKQVKETNFLVRQLYFPYRKLISDLNITSKPVIPVFYEINSESQYVKVRMFEFTDSDVYNSIREFRRFEFQLINTDEETDIDKLIAFSKTVVTEPTKTELLPQANDMAKVMTLLNDLKGNVLNKREIADKFTFDERQSDYYGNVLVYFSLA